MHSPTVVIIPEELHARLIARKRDTGVSLRKMVADALAAYLAKKK